MATLAQNTSMEINNKNRIIAGLIVITPSIVYELVVRDLFEHWFIPVLFVIGYICLAFICAVAFMQLTASFEWLYSKNSFLISLKPLYLFYKDPRNEKRNPSYKERAVHTIFGYLMYLLFFTNIYQLISLGKSNFSPENLNFVDAWYFSVVTSATVGYGDIHPTSALSKLVVTIQIVSTFLYVLSILSLLPSMLSKMNDNHE